MHEPAIDFRGDHIINGTAELGGFDLNLKPQRRATVSHVVRDLFPDGVDFTEDNFWTGLRPMTPDGRPIVGKTRLDGLYVNTGHGTLGWTLACASAHDVAAGI